MAKLSTHYKAHSLSMRLLTHIKSSLLLVASLTLSVTYTDMHTSCSSELYS